MPVSRSRPGWRTTIGSDHTRLSVTQHRRRSPPNWISNGLLRYALRAPLRSPLLQPRSCATTRLGSNPSWGKEWGHVTLAERNGRRSNTRWLFWNVALLADPRQLALQLTDLGILRRILRPLRELPFPCIERMLAHPEPLGNLRYPAAPLGDLRHRIALELVAEISLSHLRLLSSKLGKKASTNPGAIQSGVGHSIYCAAQRAC